MFSILSIKTRAQSATKIKKIIEESKDIMMEADIHSRIQPLRDLLTETITHVHEIFEVHVFVALCRGFWDRMGQVCCPSISILGHVGHCLIVFFCFLKSYAIKGA